MQTASIWFQIRGPHNELLTMKAKNTRDMPHIGKFIYIYNYELKEFTTQDIIRFREYLYKHIYLSAYLFSQNAWEISREKRLRQDTLSVLFLFSHKKNLISLKKARHTRELLRSIKAKKI